VPICQGYLPALTHPPTFSRTNADGSLPDNVTVTFRFNGSYAVSTNSISQNAAMCRMGIAGTCAAYMYRSFFNSQCSTNRKKINFCFFSICSSTGFVDLQTALIEALALQELDISLNLTGAAQAYPLPAYTTTSLVLLNLTAIYMVIAFSPLVQFLLVNIVVEKEKKIKEGNALLPSLLHCIEQKPPTRNGDDGPQGGVVLFVVVCHLRHADYPHHPQYNYISKFLNRLSSSFFFL